MSEAEAQTQSPEAEMRSALFAQLILQQSNMAMMLLGKVAHPETGQVTKDFDAAKLFIDQLEMLQEKTKGNLTKEESALLKQSLMSLQMAFVEAVESSNTPTAPPTPEKVPAQENTAPPPPQAE